MVAIMTKLKNPEFSAFTTVIDLISVFKTSFVPCLKITVIVDESLKQKAYVNLSMSLKDMSYICEFAQF